EVHPAQPRRAGRAGGPQGLHRLPARQVPAVEERDQARLRRGRLRHPARAFGARGGYPRARDRRHLPAGERQDRRALGRRPGRTRESGKRQRDVLMRAALFIGLLATAVGAAAQPVEEVLTVKRGGYAISGLAMKGAQAQPKQGIALFPGHPGIMKIQSETQFQKGGNFLIRSRRHWIDAETMVLSVDAPSDQWATFYQVWRESARYGEDVAALVEAAARRYGVQDWTFVGTSEGSLSAFHAARMNPRLARRVILTASVFEASRNGPGLSRVNFADLASPLLWVHHVDDPCQYTPYRAAQAFSKKSNAPLVSVRGGEGWSGGLCQARTAHGFVGIEIPTVQAMRSWVKTGQVPNDVGP